MDFVTLGELLIDMFPAETGRHFSQVTAFLPKPGGAPANVASRARGLARKPRSSAKWAMIFLANFCATCCAKKMWIRAVCGLTTTRARRWQ